MRCKQDATDFDVTEQTLIAHGECNAVVWLQRFHTLLSHKMNSEGAKTSVQYIYFRYQVYGLSGGDRITARAECDADVSNSRMQLVPKYVFRFLQRNRARILRVAPVPHLPPAVSPGTSIIHTLRR